MASKLQREWQRLRLQIADHLSTPSEWLAQRRRDADLLGDCRLSDGEAPPSPKVAVFLIWQPSGLAASTFLSLEALRAAGYTPFVVSNAPLSKEDRARLGPHVWKLLERPNIGHDFGGYRHAILLLAQWRISPEALLLLNDSIWFPLAQADALLPALSGVTGFSGAAWMERPDRPHAAHFQSYLVHFGPKALASTAFWDFWRRYLVSSRRSKVLKRGEKGLSKAMRRAGLIARDAFPPEIAVPARMLAHAEAASDEELRKFLGYGVFKDFKRPVIEEQLLQESDATAFRRSALALIGSSLRSGYFLERHPYLAAKSSGAHVLKKRREKISREGRAQFLAAVAAGDISAPCDILLDEIRGRDQ